MGAVSDQEWVPCDREGVMRQRLQDVDDRSEDVLDLIEATPNAAEFQEAYDISWLYHENGLEGVVLTYPEIKSAVDNKIVSDVSLLPTYRHIENQKWCIDQIRDRAKQKRAVISIGFLKEMHGKLVDDEEEAGTYRKDIPIHRTYFHEIAQPTKIHQTLVPL